MLLTCILNNMSEINPWIKIFELYFKGEGKDIKCPVCDKKEIKFTEQLLGNTKLTNAFCNSCHSHQEIRSSISKSES